MTATPTKNRFTLKLQHGFYADGICKDLEVRVSQRTQRMLGRSRWVFRTQKDGLSIFRGSPVADRLEEPLCVFLLLRNPEFPLFTAPLPTDTEPLPRLATTIFTAAAEADSAELTPAAGQLTEGQAPIPPQILRAKQKIATSEDATEALTLALANLAAIVVLPADLFDRFPDGAAMIAFSPRLACWEYKIRGRGQVSIVDTPDGKLELLDAPSVEANSLADGLKFTRTQNGEEGCTFLSQVQVSCRERPQRMLVLCEEAPPPSKGLRKLMLLPPPPLRSLDTRGSQVPILSCVVTLPPKN